MKDELMCETSPFEKDLVFMLKKMRVEDTIIQSIQKFDFSNSLGQLVLSIPGTFKDMGCQRIKNIVSKMNIKTFPPSILCQCSSLGKLTTEWLDSLLKSLQGLNQNENSTASLKLLYPSKQTVLNSCQPQAGGVFFFNPNSKYPAGMLRDCISPNNRLMHSKIILASHSKEMVYILNDCSNEEKTGYMYIGSHNTSKAAFGQKSGEALRFSNWELGIVFKLGKAGIEFAIPFDVDAPENTKPWQQSLS